MKITENAPWEQQNFEVELLRAQSAAELTTIKRRTPEKLRRSTMVQWASDGRYEWLAEKFQILYEYPQERAKMFWTSKKSSWPAVGAIVRETGNTHKNKALIVVSISQEGVMTVQDEDGKQFADAPMEVFQPWPQQGDKVTFLIREYLDWLVSLKNIHIENEKVLGQIEARLKAYGAEQGHIGGSVLSLMRSYELVSVSGNVGVVAMDGKVQCPLNCLVVV